MRGPAEIASALQKAVALHQQGRFPEAFVLYEGILKVDPKHFEAHCLLGVVESQRMNFLAAAGHFGRALRLDSNSAPAHAGMGDALLALGRFAEAVASFDRALAIEPSRSELLNNRGNALLKLERRDEALASYDRSLAINPGVAEVLYNRGNLWRELGRLEEALADYAAALSVKPDYAQALHHSGAALRGFELHDRSRFETYAVSLGPDRKDAMRARLETAFHRFIDVHNRSDREIAGLLRDLEIYIAVDLKGYAQHSRPNILAFRPAPVQVSYLGYPGTMGAPFIDSLLADRFVIPERQRPLYGEHVVYLPDAYQPNDSKRRIGGVVGTRTEAGLPPAGFVFCSFVAHYKIVPRVFDSWMNILAKVEGSVL